MIPILIRELHTKEPLWAGSYWCEPQKGSVLLLSTAQTDERPSETKMYGVVNILHGFMEGYDVSVQRVEIHAVELDASGNPKRPNIITPGTIH